MSYWAKQKNILYKKYKIDIWGLLKNSLQLINTINKEKYFFPLIFKERKNFKKLEKAMFIKNFDQEQYLKSLIYKAISSLKKNSQKKEFIKGAIEYKQLQSNLKYMDHCLKFFTHIIQKFFKVNITKRSNFFLMTLLVNTKHYHRRKKIFFRIPFIFEFRKYFIKQKIYKTNPRSSSLFLTRLFFVIYNYKQLKKLAKKAKRKDGVFEQNYLSLMELKLPAYIYRASFLPNMFESIKFIKQGNVWINKEFKPLVYYSVKPMDMVGFRVAYKVYIFWAFYKRLKRKAFMFLFPQYLYVSLYFFYIFLIKYPLKEQLINPIKIDLYRAANYAN